jgi:hypothetical protein
MSKLITRADGVKVVAGRKLLLVSEPELISKFVSLVEDVFYVSKAAEGLGIHRQTAERWMKNGETHKKKTHPDGDNCTLYCEEDMVAFRRFFDEVKSAQTRFTQENMQMIKSHRPKNWMAGAWLLERTQPDEFGLKTRTETTHKGRVDHIHTLVPLEQRQKLLKAANDALMLESTQEIEEADVISSVQDED